MRCIKDVNIDMRGYMRVLRENSARTDYQYFFKILEDFITPKLSSDALSIKKNVEGQYQYIPLNEEKFIDQMSAVCRMLPYLYDNTAYKFVDVGCGIGSKLLLVDKLFPYTIQPIGIEITPEYVEVAKRLVPKADIRETDAMTVDYSEFDIIYFYSPFCYPPKQQKLESQIIDTAKSGAYVLANLTSSKYFAEKPMRHVWGDVIFQKE